MTVLQPETPESAEFDLPESGSGGLQPGLDLDDRSTVEDAMEVRIEAAFGLCDAQKCASLKDIEKAIEKGATR